MDKEPTKSTGQQDDGQRFSFLNERKMRRFDAALQLLDKRHRDVISFELARIEAGESITSAADVYNHFKETLPDFSLEDAGRLQKASHAHLRMAFLQTGATA